MKISQSNLPSQSRLPWETWVSTGHKSGSARLSACWRPRPSRCSRCWPRSPSTAGRALCPSARSGLRSRRLVLARARAAHPGRHSPAHPAAPVRSRLDPLRSRDRALLRLARSDRRLARVAPGVQLSGARRRRCRASRPRAGVEAAGGGARRRARRRAARRSRAASAARSIRSGSRSRSRLRSSMRRTCSSPTACWGRLSRSCSQRCSARALRPRLRSAARRPGRSPWRMPSTHAAPRSRRSRSLRPCFRSPPSWAACAASARPARRSSARSSRRSTIGLSALVFGERLTPVQLLGAALVVSAVVIVQARARTRPRPVLVTLPAPAPRPSPSSSRPSPSENRSYEKAWTFGHYAAAHTEPM